MKNKQIADPDLAIIDLVNACVADRQQEAEDQEIQRRQEAEQRKRAAENRALLARMSREQEQSRKDAWWRGFRTMVIEAGTFAIGGVAVLSAMAQSLVDPRVGVPIFVICMIWTAIRIDRFVRK